MFFQLAALITLCAAQCTYTPKKSDVLPEKLLYLVYPEARGCLNAIEPLVCARTYIDDMNVQLSFLLAKRLEFAAVAGIAKHEQGIPLDDETRDKMVIGGFEAGLEIFGSDKSFGKKFGKWLIKETLEYEEDVIAESCPADGKPGVS